MISDSLPQNFVHTRMLNPRMAQEWHLNVNKRKASNIITMHVEQQHPSVLIKLIS